MELPSTLNERWQTLEMMRVQVIKSKPTPTLSNLLMSFLIVCTSFAQTDESYETVGFLQAGELWSTSFSNGFILRGGYDDDSAPAYKWLKSELSLVNGGIANMFPVIGVPAGPWAPTKWDEKTQTNIPVGPSVIGNTDFYNTYSYPLEDQLEWNDGSQDISRRMVLRDLMSVTGSVGNTPLAPTSNLPLTWPENIYGVTAWPDDFIYSEQQDGSLRADQQFYIEFEEDDDHYYPQSYDYPLDVKATLRGMSFTNAFMKDILVYSLEFINNSENAYTDVYYGLSNYFTGGPQMRSNTHHITMDSTSHVDEWEMEYRFITTAEHRFVQASDQVYMGTVYFESDNPSDPNARLSGIHGHSDYIFGRSTPLHRIDSVFYGMMAGDTSYILDEDYRNFFTGTSIDGGFNFYRPPSNSQKLFSWGPTDFFPGDTIRVAFALIVAHEKELLFQKAQIANNFVQNNFQPARAPLPPKARAFSVPTGIKVVWENSGELDRDPISGYLDFEGYRVYRSDRPPEFAEWVGPLYKEDKINSVRGAAYYNAEFYLGDDTGLNHSFIDSTALPGMTYWYLVQTYDHGVLTEDPLKNPLNWPLMPAQDSGFPSTSDVQNVASATFQALPQSSQDANVILERGLGSTGSGVIEVDVVNRSLINGHSYEFTFEDTSQGTMLVNIVDTETGLNHASTDKLDGDFGAWIDGFRVSIQDYDVVEEDLELTGWINSESNWDIFFWMFSDVDPDSAGDFLFIYDEVRTLPATGKKGPWDIIHVPSGEPYVWEIFRDGQNDDTSWEVNNWTSGDELVIMRPAEDGRLEAIAFLTLTADPILYLDDTGDTVRIDLQPEFGDTLLLATQRPWKTGDSFTVHTEKLQIDLEQDNSIPEPGITVFPNPYLVNAPWDFGGSHRIAFKGLPQQCDIKVFTQSGQLIWSYEHDTILSETAYWNLKNLDNMDVAYGLYLWVVETESGDNESGKIVVIR